MVKQARKHKSIDLGGLALPRSPYIRQQRSFGIKGFFSQLVAFTCFFVTEAEKDEKWADLSFYVPCKDYFAKEF